MRRRTPLDDPFDRTQDRLNRRLGWGLVACLLVPLPVNLLEDAVPPVPDVVEDVAGTAYMAVTGILLVASLVLPLVVFAAARSSRARSISRALRRAAIAQGFGFALLAAMFGLAARPAVWGTPAFSVAAVALAIAVAACARMTTTPGPRPGFSATAIAMILSVLSLLALPYFGDTRARAYLSAIKSDLKNVQALQEIHHDTTGAYVARVDTAQLSRGVVIDQLEVTPDGWYASARHEELPGTRCAVFTGSTPLPPATLPDTVECSPGRFISAGGRVAGFGGAGILLIGAILYPLVRRDTRSQHRPAPAIRRTT